MMIERLTESLHRRADIENAMANAQNALNDGKDISDALAELAEMLAEQDDAICELAEMITEVE